jgi:integrase
VVASLGYCDPPVRTGYNHAPGIEGTDPAWAGWAERWHATSPLTPKVRAIIRTIVAKAGRWLAAEHPGITEPGQWKRETCAAWVAAVDRMAVGDYVQRRDHLHGRAGKPVSPRTKAHILMATRTFFRDGQEWEWFPRRFDPTRALAVPRSVGALISTDPRVIADDGWAKLLWAGLNIEAADLPGTSAGSYYPMQLIRALTLTWLFSGQRSDEISRLRVGCIRWQHDGLPVPGDSRDILAADAVCLLDVPVHKTGTAFTKPVDPLVGQAIEAWQALRPAQPPRLDRKTSEYVDLLFSVRAHPVGKTYINRTIIPALCAKAGVQRMLAAIPLTDDERAAVDDGQAALDSLLGRLADIPTPAGATPRELGTSPGPTFLPGSVNWVCQLNGSVALSVVTVRSLSRGESGGPRPEHPPPPRRPVRLQLRDGPAGGPLRAHITHRGEGLVRDIRADLPV